MRALIALLLLAGCGYHTEPSSGSSTVSIPHIKGDSDGILANALAQALNASGAFDYTYSGGNATLDATIIADGDDRIGFRYDRNPKTGKLRDNIVGTENRRSLAVEIKLTETHTGKVLFGPEVIRSTVDYDYVDDNSIYDLTFSSNGTAQTVLNFSLGQLDSFEGAHDDTHTLLYNQIAQKIVTRLFLNSIQ